MTTAQIRKETWNLGRRAVLAALLLVGAGLAHAQSGTVKTNAFPSLALSDGSSPVVITAEIRDDKGQLVPDGTPVVFETKVGTFDQQTQTTQSGVAKATLRAPSIPGLAVVRVSVLRYNAFGETTVEFVKERQRVESSLRQLEVVGGASLNYSVQDRVVEATGPKQTAIVRYGKVEIAADDMQVHVIDGIVTARHAALKIGETQRQFDELNYNLKTRQGTGVAEIETPGRVVPTGRFAQWIPGRTRLGYVDVSGVESKPRATPIDPDTFKYVSVVDSLSIISASHATVVQDRNVQFQHATVRMGGEVLMKVPLFDFPLTASSQAISEQFFQVNNNQVALNFPYYLSLTPSTTSLFRMRYSTPFAGGLGYAAGTYLDYELSWNQGDGGNGALTVGGIGRDDWGINLRQSWLTPSSTIITASLDTPSHQSLLGNLGVNQPFKGGSASIALGASRSLNGLDARSTSASAVIQSDARKIHGTPFRLSTGLTATSNEQSLGDLSNRTTAMGLQTRFNMDPIPLAGLGRLRFGYTVSELASSGRWGTSHNAMVGLSTQLRKGWVLDTQYDYTQDPFATLFLGKHRVTADSYFTQGAWSIHGSVLQMLDFDRSSARFGLEHRFSNLWRFNFDTITDLLQGEVYQDKTVGIGYRLGMRELGLTYSERTHRLGLEVRG